MSEIKHTPGPWVNHGRITQPGLPHSAVAAETLIARVYSKHFGDTEQEIANANLIAAAPELLEAVQSLLKFVSDPAGFSVPMLSDKEKFGEFMRSVKDRERSAIDLARAAIAKATGAS